jgi:hypothetical protein
MRRVPGGASSRGSAAVTGCDGSGCGMFRCAWVRTTAPNAATGTIAIRKPRENTGYWLLLKD